jgi:hypothetical protein
MLRARITGDSIDPDEADYKGLMDEYNYLEKQNIDLDTKLNQQLLQNVEYKKRVLDLNKQVLKLTSQKQNESM